MNNPVNFDRQYRFVAGSPNGEGFECGGTKPHALHIAFQVQRTELETENTAKIQLWNLSPDRLAVLNEKDCAVSLRVGYENRLALCFSGTVTYVETEREGADQMTTLEASDGRVPLRDTWLSLSYGGTVNGGKVLEDVAASMGVTAVYGHNAAFANLSNGYSYVGRAGSVLDKICASSGLSWSIQNGVLHIKKQRDTILRECYVLSSNTGLVGTPKKITLSQENSQEKNQPGWDVEHLMNAAIQIDDYVRLESEKAQGYFRVCSQEISGDNLEGDWLCTSRLLEV